MKGNFYLVRKQRLMEYQNGALFCPFSYALSEPWLPLIMITVIIISKANIIRLLTFSSCQPYTCYFIDLYPKVLRYKHYHPLFINRENTMFPKSRHPAQIRVPDLHGY